ncbi:hypothetical protein V6260_18615, partial [Pseudoalteromonas aliena]|uniref:hypothetical protein n=1 Tax=Pseudoalteromonas aliena TaxID=247523 RepID=UPI00311E027B
QTKVGKKLKLKDYTDAAVQAAMTDEEIIKVTTEGVVVDGKEKMMGFKDELSPTRSRTSSPSSARSRPDPYWPIVSNQPGRNS